MERDSKPVIKIGGQNKPVKSKLGNHGLLKQQQEYSADAHRRLSDADYIRSQRGTTDARRRLPYALCADDIGLRGTDTRRMLSDDIGQLQQGTVMTFLLYNSSLPL